MSGVRVPVISRDGEIGTVDDAELSDALRAGATVATKSEVAEGKAAAIARETYGAAAAPVAGVVGAARGLTLGLSDKAAVEAERLRGGDKAASVASEQLRGLRAESPTASVIGEIGGNVAPLILSGGTSAGARAVKIAGAPVLGAEALGRGAEVIAMRALPAAEGMVGRVARGVAGSAVRGAVEGAAYGAGHAISESAIEDHDLTAEELFASAGGMALFGGAAGGALAAPMVVAGEAGRAAIGIGSRVADRAGELVASASAHATELATKAADAGEMAIGKVSANDVLGRADRAASDAVLEHTDVMRLSDEQSARSTYARKKFVQEAEARFRPGPEGEPGGWAGVGRLLKDTKVVDLEAGVQGNLHSPEELLPRIEKAAEERGARLGQIARESGATVRVGDIAKELNEVIAPFRALAGREGLVSSLEGFRDSLYGQLGAYSKEGRLLIGKRVPLGELRAQRLNLQEMAYQEAKSLDPTQRVAQLREMRNALDGLEVDAMVADGANATEIAKLKREYQGLRIARDATEDSVARGSANRSVGATDYLGFVAGSAAGGPLLGGAMAIANKIARERGSAAASVFLHDVATTKSLATAIRRATRGPITEAGAGALETGQQMLGQATAKLEQHAALNALAKKTEAFRSHVSGRVSEIASATSARVTAFGERSWAVAKASYGAAIQARKAVMFQGYSKVEDYQRRRREVEALAQPGAVARVAGEHTDALGAAAPGVAMAFGAAAQRGVDVALKYMPPSFVDENSLTPFAKQARSLHLTAPEMRWMRVLRVLDNPTVALAGVQDGTLSLAEADALREAYPKVFEAMKLAIVAKAAARDPKEGPMPYQLVTHLSTLFGEPLHATLTPRFVAALQATNDPESADQQPGANAPKPSGRPLNLKLQPTPGEEVEGGLAHARG